MKNTIIKTIILASVLIILAGMVNAAIWVKDGNNCPTSYQALSCSGVKHMCGTTGGALDPTLCELAPTITGSVPGGDGYTESGNYGLAGGYVTNCASAGTCKNAWTCQRQTSCYNAHRKTKCIGGGTTSTCVGCWATRLDCNGIGDGSDGDCEVTKHSTTFPGVPNARYATTCSTWECKPSYQNCDGQPGNGCEIKYGALGVGESCTRYDNGASGYCSNCGTSGYDSNNNDCNCIQVPPVPFETGVKAEYTTTNPLLWGKQLGTGWLLKLTNSTGADFGINHGGCIVFPSGLEMCAPQAGGSFEFEGDIECNSLTADNNIETLGGILKTATIEIGTEISSTTGNVVIVIG